MARCTKEQLWEKVTGFFAEKSATLLTMFDEFKNSTTKLKYLCTSCGKEHTTDWAHIANGAVKNLLCPDCRLLLRYGKDFEKDWDFAVKSFEAKGLQMGISKEDYKGQKTPLPYNCICCGKECTVTVWQLKHSDFSFRCIECSRNKTPFSVIEDFFASKGIVLLTKESEYKNSKSLLRYRCVSCGEEGTATWGNISNGHAISFTCMKCSPARRVTYDLVSDFCASNGSEILSSAADFHGPKFQFDFRCISCGGVGTTRWGYVNRFNTPGEALTCNACKRAVKNEPARKRSWDDIQNFFDSKGVTLLTKYEDYKTTKDSLHYLCSECGEETTTTWDTIRRGYNSSLRCGKCSGHDRTDFKLVQDYFKEKGVDLLTGEKDFTGNSSFLYFKCSKCGAIHHITWDCIKRGINKDLLCHDCMPTARTAFDKVKDFFESNNIKLLTCSEDFFNENTPLRFLCPRCSKEHTVTWTNIKQRRNKNFLCPDCFRASLYSAENSLYNGSRPPLTGWWDRRVKMFYGLKAFYNVSSHHMFLYSEHPEAQLSVTNGYPLPKDVHPIIKDLHKEFHHTDYMDPSTWPDDFKCHPVDCVRNLHDFIQSDILDHTSDFKAMQERKKKNLTYIPFFFDEICLPSKQEIAFSMLRAKIFPLYPDVYKQTGCELNVYQARNLLLKSVSKTEERRFFEENHIQGFAASKVCLGLYTKDTDDLVAAMSFGNPRQAKYRGEGHYEMIRFASKINTVVRIGADRLFKNFIRIHNPVYILSYCDIRLSAVKPEDTVYTRLGFTYKGKTQPNYYYVRPEDNIRMSRNMFQKHKLRDRLEHFDPDKTEKENMLENGYVPVYDCGSYIFEWKSE